MFKTEFLVEYLIKIYIAKKCKFIYSIKRKGQDSRFEFFYYCK